jgi:hypothetical protein
MMLFVHLDTGAFLSLLVNTIKLAVLLVAHWYLFVIILKFNVYKSTMLSGVNGCRLYFMMLLRLMSFIVTLPVEQMTLQRFFKNLYVLTLHCFSWVISISNYLAQRLSYD